MDCLVIFILGVDMNFLATPCAWSFCKTRRLERYPLFLTDIEDWTAYVNFYLGMFDLLRHKKLNAFDIVAWIPFATGWEESEVG